MSDGRASERFTIRWDDSMGCYRVNIPNYEGGEVVTAEAHDAEVEHLRSLFGKALEEIIEDLDARRRHPDTYPGEHDVLTWAIWIVNDQLAPPSLDAPSDPSDTPVSGFGHAREAGT